MKNFIFTFCFIFVVCCVYLKSKQSEKILIKSSITSISVTTLLTIIQGIVGLLVKAFIKLIIY